MALQGKYEKNGLVALNAYVQIDRFDGSRAAGWNVHITIYSQPPAVVDGVVVDRFTVVEHFTVNVPYIPGEDPYATAYREVKNDDRLNNFTDTL